MSAKEKEKRQWGVTISSSSILGKEKGDRPLMLNKNISYIYTYFCLFL